MHCPMRFEWIKLRRAMLPEGKGIMSAWAKLASRAAFRKGIGYYCGHANEVVAGMWSGGIVGLKSILGVKSRAKVWVILDKLATLGYIEYEYNAQTKKLSYSIMDWVAECSGGECTRGGVYATQGYGFLCVPRNITDRLAARHYKFEEADAWLDLWCHTVYGERSNAFSFYAPTVQYGPDNTLSLETLGKRWGWEKTKVWRFFQKHGNVFALYRLPGSYGCLIFNKEYPAESDFSLPTKEEVAKLWRVSNDKPQRPRRTTRGQCARCGCASFVNRVAHFAPIIRAYLSQCRDSRNYDCKDSIVSRVVEMQTIGGVCRVFEIHTQRGELP